MLLGVPLTWARRSSKILYASSQGSKNKYFSISILIPLNDNPLWRHSRLPKNNLNNYSFSNSHKFVNFSYLTEFLTQILCETDGSVSSLEHNTRRSSPPETAARQRKSMWCGRAGGCDLAGGWRPLLSSILNIKEGMEFVYEVHSSSSIARKSSEKGLGSPTTFFVFLGCYGDPRNWVACQPMMILVDWSGKKM